MSEKINVLLIEPGKYPKQIEIEDTLEAMQETVGGYIEEYMTRFQSFATRKER